MSNSSSNGSEQKIVSVASNGIEATTPIAGESSSICSNGEELKILGQLKTIEQINEQRRIFLNSTISEETNEKKETKVEEKQKQEEEQVQVEAKPNSLVLNVKYATLPSPNVVTMRSPMSPPPKPPMLSRTRSIGSGDGRSPVTNGAAEATLMRQSLTETALSTAATAEEPNGAAAAEPPTTVSARHYEGLIEELRCPGCAGAMKAPILLCKSGHSVCEQCTRILLMCPLCKESFTNSRSLTVEALCAKAHFRCSHAAGGCQVRMPVALLPWHEQQCIYKPMKCFMGRVWGECKWQGREVQWKEHLEEQHADKLFRTHSSDLVWNMAVRRKPLTGYYVFQAHDEMFNFYEIYDKQRILFTMTCTSNRRESKYNYAYEVTLLQPDNEALSMTQKFPVHSEYDRDILMDGTCVSIPLNELSRFIDTEKQVLHYRVSVLAVKSPRRAKPPRQSLPVPIDYEQTKNAGVNGKSVPANMIITRTYKEGMGVVDVEMEPEGDGDATASTPDSEDDPNTNNGQELERKWGTPQLHFNRKYLRNNLGEGAAGQQEDELRPLSSDRRGHGEDKLSLCSNSNSYTKKVSDSLRKSFRALKADIIELRPFAKKSTAKAPIGNGSSPPRVHANVAK